MKKHNAYAVWNGSLKEGKGTLTTKSKVLNNNQYSFKTRFEDGAGTNPDELLAASHAGCFAMALSLILGQNGFTPDSIDVNAEVTMDPEKLALTGSHLTLKAKIPNIDQKKFMEIANAAKENCPISKALSLPISLDASLV
ncbi:MAG: OsmC family protein [Ignavibacteriales bacterium]|jgi:osmotically inducible protein OsmC|nr:MAG: OsmC family protein [Ignavibacterium sp.]MCZ2269465.1 OsmC family protein [Ignavibacteriales bacterium]MDX9711587.1 OsmC family protein [Ignavibacteriaceae bacterium]GIK22671.1 MAG: osmotically inducible protein OsmC [Ignavibacteriota bacterium]MBW7843338.1 OsmC family protein [Ignavibacterium sp.]